MTIVLVPPSSTLSSILNSGCSLDTKSSTTCEREMPVSSLKFMACGGRGRGEEGEGREGGREGREGGKGGKGGREMKEQREKNEEE